MNVLIVGLGIIGGGYCQKLIEHYNVYGIDNKNTIDYAYSHGFILNNKCDDELYSIADAIILCCYPNDCLKIIKEKQYLFKTNVFITDTCGVKSQYLDTLSSFLRKDITYISHHPMAGKEVSGIQNADPNIFKNANFIIIGKESENSRFLKEIAHILEFSNIVYLSSKEHDDIVGYLSHLTHILAITLMNAKDTHNYIKYTGDSFRDLTRIAKINENLWAELFLSNKKNLLDQIELFEKKLNEFKNAIINDDCDKMKMLMKESTRRREMFDEEMKSGDNSWISDTTD